MANNKLSGNPIILNIYTGVNASGRYRIYTGAGYATLLHDGTAYSISGTAQVDVTDLFAGLINTAGVSFAKMVIVDSLGVEYDGDPADDTKLYEFVVFGGGISDALLRKLTAASTDIFAWKLKNNNGNFLLSTRTNSRILYIPETEIAPLKYYAKGMYVIVRAGNVDIGTYDHTLDADESVASIDFKALRRQHFDESGELVNIFEIKNELEEWSMSVVITEAEPASYKLKFRNSWGVDELIAIEGDISYQPEFTEKEPVMIYDNIVNRLVENAQRKSFKSVYTADLGYRDINGRMFILDAIMSDRCSLQVNGIDYACKLSANTQTFDTTTPEPLPVQVKITLTDVNYSAGNLLNMAALTGVFDEEYAEEFE